MLCIKISYNSLFRSKRTSRPEYVAAHKWLFSDQNVETNLDQAPQEETLSPKALGYKIQCFSSKTDLRKAFYVTLHQILQVLEYQVSYANHIIATSSVINTQQEKQARDVHLFLNRIASSETLDMLPSDASTNRLPSQPPCQDKDVTDDTPASATSTTALSLQETNPVPSQNTDMVDDLSYSMASS
jgi:hypothetical protein